MFKLTRIQNAGSNVPETLWLPVGASASYVCGEAVHITAGAATACAATDKPTHIIAERDGGGSEKGILAYRITPDMLFDAPISAAPSSLAVGDKVTLTVTSGHAIGVTATTTGGVATVEDLCGASAAGDTVTVRFI